MVLILYLLSGKIGDEFDGVVSGLANFGVFVKLKKFGIEGLVQLTDLGADQWQYNQKAKCITGENSGYTIRLGQPMKVRIVSVNIPTRQLAVTPAERLIKTSKKTMSGLNFDSG